MSPSLPPVKEPVQNLSPGVWDIKQRHPDLAALAVQAFGDEKAALDWFFSVHPEWGLLPAFVARTQDGAARVSAELAAILAAKRS